MDVKACCAFGEALLHLRVAEEKKVGCINPSAALHVF